MTHASPSASVRPASNVRDPSPSVSARERLLDAAVAEFATHRFPQASLNRIIQQAGASKGSFYHHFKDKKQLYAEVLIRAAQVVFADWEVHPPDALQADTYWEGLRALTEASAQAFCRHPGFIPLWRHFQEDARHLQDDPQIRAIMAAGQQTLATHLQRGVALGLVRSDLSIAELVELYEAADRVIDGWFFVRANAIGVDAAMTRQVHLIVDLLRRLTEVRPE